MSIKIRFPKLYEGKELENFSEIEEICDCEGFNLDCDYMFGQNQKQSIRSLQEPSLRICTFFAGAKSISIYETLQIEVTVR